jgi:hypothetical protein
MKILNCLAVYFLLLAFGCKKDGDVINTVTVHGQVYNICNDSGLANIPVYLQENGVNIAQTLSGANGGFSFTDAKMHSSGAYTYVIYVYSRGAASPAIDGASVQVPNFATTTNYLVKVMPRFYEWRVFCLNTTFLSSDTFSVVFKQNVVHPNLTNANDNVWTVTNGCPCGFNPEKNLANLSNFPAGMWQVTLTRTKNGLQTTQTANIYVGWGDTQNDTLSW